MNCPILEPPKELGQGRRCITTDRPTAFVIACPASSGSPASRRSMHRRPASPDAFNRFVREVHLPEHNVRFAVAPDKLASAFVEAPEALWRDVLTSQEERRVGNDNHMRYDRPRLADPADTAAVTLVVQEEGLTKPSKRNRGKRLRAAAGGARAHTEIVAGLTSAPPRSV